MTAITKNNLFHTGIFIVILKKPYLKNDPGFNQQRLDEAEKKLDELEALFKQKYRN